GSVVLSDRESVLVSYHDPAHKRNILESILHNRPGVSLVISPVLVFSPAPQTNVGGMRRVVVILVDRGPVSEFQPGTTNECGWNAGRRSAADLSLAPHKRMWVECGRVGRKTNRLTTSFSIEYFVRAGGAVPVLDSQRAGPTV
ncbi:hypothetical protein TNCV_1484351, partial [Trichonephila clavipes]